MIVLGQYKNNFSSSSPLN